MNSPSPERRLHGKVALVTGGAQGIGQAIAQRLAREGADIALNVHRDDDRAREARDALAATGVRCQVFAADVGDVAALRAMVDAVVTAFGSLDILVNNAGVEHNAALADISEQDWDLVMRTNLKGPVFLSQAFARHASRAGRGGRIVNISSVHEDLPFPHFTPYCASKGGLKMVTRNLAIELAPLGITVNSVAPGAIRTPINEALLHDRPKLDALLANIPLGRLGDPGDVAGVVAFLATDDARYITGASIVVDGGLMWSYSEQ